MSIIIKGLDMPKEANVYFKVSFYGADRETEFGVSGDCRSHIIQIPKGHGRLIDGDELQELYADADGLDLSNYDVKVAVIRQNIKDMPTILEAEEE